MTPDTDFVRENQRCIRSLMFIGQDDEPIGELSPFTIPLETFPLSNNDNDILTPHPGFFSFFPTNLFFLLFVPS